MRSLVDAAIWREAKTKTRHRIWIGSTPTGLIVCKQYASARAHSQACRALRNIRVEGTPRLLHSDPSARMVLLEHLDGVAVDPSDADAHAAAGAWLRRLQRCATAGSIDTVELPEAIEMRIQAALAQAPHSLATAAHRHLSALPPLPYAQRVWSHRDFQPQNWLSSSRHGLCVVDFEHARPDHPVWDLVKLECGVWRSAPHTRQAFFHAYGPEPDPTSLTRLCWLHAVQTFNWGARHHDAALRTEGDSIVQWLTARGSQS